MNRSRSAEWKRALVFTGALVLGAGAMTGCSSNDDGGTGRQTNNDRDMDYADMPVDMAADMSGAGSSLDCAPVGVYPRTIPAGARSEVSVTVSCQLRGAGLRGLMAEVTALGHTGSAADAPITRADGDQTLLTYQLAVDAPDEAMSAQPVTVTLSYGEDACDAGSGAICAQTLAVGSVAAHVPVEKLTPESPPAVAWWMRGASHRAVVRYTEDGALGLSASEEQGQLVWRSGLMSEEQSADAVQTQAQRLGADTWRDTRMLLAWATRARETHRAFWLGITGSGDTARLVVATASVSADGDVSSLALASHTALRPERIADARPVLNERGEAGLRVLFAGREAGEPRWVVADVWVNDEGATLTPALVQPELGDASAGTFLEQKLSAGLVVREVAAEPARAPVEVSDVLFWTVRARTADVVVELVALSGSSEGERVDWSALVEHTPLNARVRPVVWDGGAARGYVIAGERRDGAGALALLHTWARPSTRARIVPAITRLALPEGYHAQLAALDGVGTLALEEDVLVRDAAGVTRQLTLGWAPDAIPATTLPTVDARLVGAVRAPGVRALLDTPEAPVTVGHAGGVPAVAQRVPCAAPCVVPVGVSGGETIGLSVEDGAWSLHLGGVTTTPSLFGEELEPVAPPRVLPAGAGAHVAIVKLGRRGAGEESVALGAVRLAGEDAPMMTTLTLDTGDAGAVPPSTLRVLATDSRGASRVGWVSPEGAQYVGALDGASLATITGDAQELVVQRVFSPGLAAGGSVALPHHVLMGALHQPALALVRGVTPGVRAVGEISDALMDADVQRAPDLLAVVPVEGGACKLATVLYPGTTDGYEEVMPIQLSTDDAECAGLERPVAAGDVLGVGGEQFVTVRRAGADELYTLWWREGARVFAAELARVDGASVVLAPLDARSVFLVDVNGDGMDDLVRRFDDAPARLFLSDGQGGALEGEGVVVPGLSSLLSPRPAPFDGHASAAASGGALDPSSQTNARPESL